MIYFIVFIVIAVPAYLTIKRFNSIISSANDAIDEVIQTSPALECKFTLGDMSKMVEDELEYSSVTNFSMYYFCISLNGFCNFLTQPVSTWEGEKIIFTKRIYDFDALKDVMLNFSPQDNRNRDGKNVYVYSNEDVSVSSSFVNAVSMEMFKYYKLVFGELAK